MAKIHVKLGQESERKQASRFILGHFTEHLGLCIENGIWMYEETSEELLGMKNLERVRKDLFNAMEILKPPVIRYPGGCFSDTYHWKDGIGPRESRPTRKNEAWGKFNLLWKLGPKERNHFGTDEFLALCEALGAKPYLNVNLGTGTPAEAAEWVEYVNGDSGTDLGSRRAENGHEEPYGVKYWGIGNEIYGFWEKGNYRNKPREYGGKCLEFARAMKNVDPSIKLVAVGQDNNSEWNRALLEMIKDEVDYLSVHKYFGMDPGWIGVIKYALGKNAFPQTQEMYYTVLNSTCTFDRLISNTECDIKAVLGPEGLERCKIAFDEWNIWRSFRQLYRADNPPYTLRDGLWTALVLNMLIRHGNAVGMANFAQMVNCLGMIWTYEDQIVLTPHCLAFKLYGDGWLPWSVPVDVECDNITSEAFSKQYPSETAPVLDTVALVSEDGKKIALFCVNKHFSKKIKCEVNVAGHVSEIGMESIETCILGNDDPFAFNSQDRPNVITLSSGSINANGLPFTCELLPHSAYRFKINLK